jgi:hypothetical protein
MLGLSIVWPLVWLDYHHISVLVKIFTVPLAPSSVKVQSYCIIISNWVSFTGVTVIVNVWLTQLVPGVPESHTCTVITSVPKKFVFGVYTYVPSGLITGSVCWSTPLVWWLPLVVFRLDRCRLHQLSSSTVGLSSVVVLVSLSTIGASFTAVTVIVNVWLNTAYSWCSRVYKLG